MANDTTTTTRTAYFAGGCFWCMEAEFEHKDGIAEVISGYMGGSEKTANYNAVSAGNTDHFEAVEVQYNPEKVSYETLLKIYWSNVDPTDAGGQFADRGKQYHTAIFYQNAEEKSLAEASKTAIAAKLGMPIATQILPATAFYAAEEYHQGYYKKNAIHYNLYKHGSGRTDTLKKLWGDKKD